MFFFTAMLITYIKGETPAQIFLERGSAMTMATFVIFFTEVIIDWCYYTQVSYTGSWEPLVFLVIVVINEYETQVTSCLTVLLQCENIENVDEIWVKIIFHMF